MRIREHIWSMPQTIKQPLTLPAFPRLCIQIKPRAGVEGISFGKNTGSLWEFIVVWYSREARTRSRPEVIRKLKPVYCAFFLFFSGHSSFSGYYNLWIYDIHSSPPSQLFYFYFYDVLLFFFLQDNFVDESHFLGRRYKNSLHI